MISTFIKKPLNKLGIDLVRYRPQYTLGGYAYIPTLGIRTVIDAGAHAGEFARMIKKLLPGASVIAFEPLKEVFKELENSTRGMAGVKIMNYALGDTDGTLEINHNDYSQSSSLLPMAELHKQAFPESAGSRTETVEVRRLDSLLNPGNVEPEILFKIDVQGYEDKVIAGAENLIARTRAILIEVSFQKLYESQPLFDDIYLMLKERGFIYMGNLYQLDSPVDGSALQADALFIRK